MLAFNMQTRSNILPDLVFARWKQAQDLVRLFVICKIYIYSNM